MRSNLNRFMAVVAGLWAGLLLGIGAIAAPSGFAVAARETAGQIAGRMFQQEAYLSLFLAVLMFVALRHQARGQAQAGTSSVFSANMVLVLIVLLCTVVGYFALQPAMAAARQGQGMWSFAALHGVSMLAFALKGLMLLVLAWRLSAKR